MVPVRTDVTGEQQAAVRALCEAFPAMPRHEAFNIADMAFRVRGLHNVWMSADLPERDKAEALATAYVRHHMTPYDDLLPRYGDRDRQQRLRLARDLVRPRVQATLDAWRRTDGQ